MVRYYGCYSNKSRGLRKNQVIAMSGQHCPVRNLHVPAIVIPECFYRVSIGSSILDSR